MQGAENRAGWERSTDAGCDGNMGMVGTIKGNMIVIPTFLYLKLRQVMFTGKKTSARPCIPSGGSISAWYINTFLCFAVLFPLYGNAVSSVFGRKAHKSREALGFYFSQPDKANTRNGLAIKKLWPARWWQQWLHGIRAYREVYQYAAVYESVYDRNFHMSQISRNTSIPPTLQ